MAKGLRWSDEELILSLFLYNEYGMNCIPDRLLNEVSDLTDRTTSSINLRLANYAYVDPKYLGQALAGGLNQVQPIWNLYSEREDFVARLAQEFLSKLRSFNKAERERYLEESRPQGRSRRYEKIVVETKNIDWEMRREIQSLYKNSEPEAFENASEQIEKIDEGPNHHLRKRVEEQEETIRKRKQRISELHCRIQELESEDD